MTKGRQKLTAGGLGLLLAAGLAIVPAASMAAHHRGNFMERHPVMTGVAAGAIAHHMAKKHRAQ